MEIYCGLLRAEQVLCSSLLRPFSCQGYIQIDVVHQCRDQKQHYKDDDNPDCELRVYRKILIGIIICDFVISDKPALLVIK